MRKYIDLTSDISKTDYPNIKFKKGSVVKYAKTKYRNVYNLIVTEFNFIGIRYGYMSFESLVEAGKIYPNVLYEYPNIEITALMGITQDITYNNSEIWFIGELPYSKINIIINGITYTHYKNAESGTGHYTSKNSDLYNLLKKNINKEIEIEIKLLN